MRHRSASLTRALYLGPALLVIGAHLGSAVRAATWSEVSGGLSTTPVSIASITISPAQSSTIYARTIGPDGIASLFKTADGAASWTAVSSIVGVNSLITDPRDPATLYAATARGILKSVDGGISWSGTGSGLPNTYIGTLAIDPSSKIYAVVGGGIFMSTDGAATWNVPNTGIPSNTMVSFLVVDPTNPSRIFAIGAIPQNNGPYETVLLRSTDEGQTWIEVSSRLLSGAYVTSLMISASAPSVLLAVSSGPSGSAILKSGDGGDTWAALNTGLPAGTSVSSLAIDPSDSSRLYLAVDFDFAEAGGILESADGGATWSAVKPDFPANTPIDYLAIDPSMPSTFYALVNDAIFKSTNGGINWNQAMSGLSAFEVSALAVSPADASTVYSSAANSLFKSSAGGATWNSLYAFQLFNSTVPVLIPSPFLNGSPAYPRSLLIDFSNPNTLYLSTIRADGCYFDDNLLWKSTDGGMTWDNSVSPQYSGCVFGGFFGPSGGLKAMDPTDPQTLYVSESDDGDGSWLLLRSRDGGATWNDFGDFPNSLQAGVWAVAIDPTAPATIYAGIDDTPLYGDDGSVQPGVGGVYKTTDGGITWNPIGLSGAAVNLLAIDPNQPSVLYAATEGNYGFPHGFRGMFKSTDGGATWSAINSGLDRLLALGSSVTAIVIDPANSNSIYVGVSGGGVFKSSDGGATWLRFNAGLANLDVRALAMAPGSGHILYAGTSGGVFKIADTDSAASRAISRR